MWKLHIQDVSCKINTEISLQVLSLIPWLANWWIFLTLLYFSMDLYWEKVHPYPALYLLAIYPQVLSCEHSDWNDMCTLFSSMKINYKYENNTWFCFFNHGLMPTGHWCFAQMKPNVAVWILSKEKMNFHSQGKGGFDPKKSLLLPLGHRGGWSDLAYPLKPDPL